MYTESAKFTFYIPQADSLDEILRYIANNPDAERTEVETE